MIKVNLIGFKEYENRLKNASKEIQAEVSVEIQLAALEFRDGAKRDLVSQGGDTGGLLNSITATNNSVLLSTVSAEKFYAPFIEFGTKGKYRPIPGTEEFAAQYKGFKRGSYKEFIEQIKKWVKRKKIGATYNVKTRKKNRQTKDQLDTIAFLIARSILREGISPKPFFFKQITPVRANLIKRLDNILNGV